MDVLVIPDNYINELIIANSKNKEIYNIVKQIIMKYNYNYVNFIYAMFSIYNNIYISVNNKNSGLSYTEIQDLVNKLSKYKKNIIVDYIVVSDVYDFLYNLYSNEYKFNDWFYSDIFSRLSNLYYSKYVDEIFEDVIDTLSNVFSILDSNIFTYITSKYENFNSNIVIYLEIVNDYLFLNLLI